MGGRGVTVPMLFRLMENRDETAVVAAMKRGMPACLVCPDDRDIAGWIRSRALFVLVRAEGDDVQGFVMVAADFPQGFARYGDARLCNLWTDRPDPALAAELVRRAAARFMGMGDDPERRRQLRIPAQRRRLYAVARPCNRRVFDGWTRVGAVGWRDVLTTTQLL